MTRKQEPPKTKGMWLAGGQFHCDTHKCGIPFYFAPMNAKCAECSDNAPESYLARRVDRKRTVTQ